MEQKVKKYDYLVVGAGLFGSVFARLATDSGKNCLVIDKRHHIGGNCHSSKYEGIDVHTYGPHIFHTSNKDVIEFITRFADFMEYDNQPMAKYGMRYYHLPFNMHTFRDMWGVESVEQARARIEATLERHCSIESVEDYALSSIGRELYETLVKDYTEKQWGVECSLLPASILKRLPIRWEYNNSYFDDIFQGLPLNGYCEMFENLLKGIDIALGVDFIEDRKELSCIAEKIVYTGRIDEYFDYKFGVLPYRGLTFKSSFSNKESLQPYPIINHTDKSVSYTRSTDYSKLNNGTSKNSSLSIVGYEYPSFCEGATDIPCYPIPTEGNVELYRLYLTEAEKEASVLFGGRLAEYKYYNMDTTIEKAMDLWKKESKA